MPKKSGYHNRKTVICDKIRSLLISLTHYSNYNEGVASNIEYWIDHALHEGRITSNELVEGVSCVAWDDGGDFANVGRFFKEFRDSPHCSWRAEGFVCELCSHVLRWFAIASAEDLWAPSRSSLVSRGGAPGFVRAASFVGYLIKYGLLAPDPSVRWHLIKPLINHHNDVEHKHSAEAVRANALYQLFAAAGNSLLQGQEAPEDIQACFEIFETRSGWIEGFDSTRVKEFRETQAAWLRKREEERREEVEECTRGEEEDTTTAEVSTEAKTPVALVPRGLSAATTGGEIPCSTSQRVHGRKFFTRSLRCLLDRIRFPPVKHLHDMEFHFSGARRDDKTQ